MRSNIPHAYSVKYGFNQPLSASAHEAFDWCTDYQPYDFALMKEQGKRSIRKINNDTILLTEQIRKGKRTVKKTKLVRLNRPELSWTNTHISGPNKHSQFLYRIEPEGKNRSRLFFRGLLICYSREKLTRSELKKIGKQEREGDSTVWRHLAAALRQDIADR